MNTLEKRGLLLVLSIFLLTGSGLDAVAMTTSANSAASVLKLDADGLATVQGPEKPPSIQETLLAVCTSRGYGEDCAKHLLGMAWKESNFKATAIGDRGQARGWFQIWNKLHKISVNCAEDLVCSANWTIDYLESNHYPKYVKHAVQCHNGCNIANGYAASALRHGERLWNADGVQVAAK